MSTQSAGATIDDAHAPYVEKRRSQRRALAAARVKIRSRLLPGLGKTLERQCLKMMRLATRETWYMEKAAVYDALGSERFSAFWAENNMRALELELLSGLDE
jgi:hypothetical protein